MCCVCVVRVCNTFSVNPLYISVAGALHLVARAAAAQVVPEISVAHQFHDDERRKTL